MDNIFVSNPSLPLFDEYVEEIRSIWDTKKLTNSGPKLAEFSLLLENLFRSKNICLCCNGHMALETAILSLGIKGEIITSPFTFASTTQAIIRCGCTPVFCDISSTDLTIDYTKIESLITPNTGAILPVHVYGNICDFINIQKISKMYNLPVIYDAAHAFGEEINGESVSKFGDISIFSFHATKVFNSIEGGCIVYDNPSIKDRINKFINFGLNGQYDFSVVGFNAKMSEFHASMGICNLRHLNEEIEKRKIVFEEYFNILAGAAGITLYNLNASNKKNNYSYFPILIENKIFGKSRDEVSTLLEKNQIYPRKYFYPITSSFSAYRGLFPIQETPVASYVSENILCLPLYSNLQIEDVRRICNIILG